MSDHIQDVWRALQLAFGRRGHVPSDAQGWKSLRIAASRERLAPLIWIRSGAYLSEVAPPDECAAWRGAYAHSLARANHHGHALVDVIQALRAEGVSPVALKGLPLALRLYGDVAARPSSDVDLFISTQARAIARRTLRANGWMRTEGEDSGEETFARTDGSTSVHLELHSSLLHPRFSYLALPEPRASNVRILKEDIPAHDDEILSAYLAAHLATHREAPLLWFVDFSVLWGSLNAAQCQSAREVAASVGLGRYLDWAVALAQDVSRAVDRMDRLRRLGYRERGRREAHPMWRHLRLAPSARARYYAIRSWIAPSWVDRGPGFALTVARRLVVHAPTALRRSAAPIGSRGLNPLAARELVLGAPQFVPTMRETLARGAGAWCRMSGQSMGPTIAHGEEVLLRQPTPPLQVGEVVLTQTSAGPLLHRIIESNPTWIRTRGDASATSDPPCPISNVIARAEVARVGDRRITLRADLQHGLAPVSRYLWRHLRARVTMHPLRRVFTATLGLK